MTEEELTFVVELNNRKFEDARQVYDYLAQKLEFPEYFGHNLDALYDCLTDVYKPVTIRIRRTWFQKDWFKAIVKIIRLAAAENDCITVK